MSQFWLVLELHSWDSLKVVYPGLHRHAVTVTAEDAGDVPPSHFLPAFDSREAAEAWAGTARVVMVDTSGAHPQVRGPEAPP